MEQAECPPVVVEGAWGSVPSKTLRNKLQLYFQSKRKSSGGDCRVEAEDGAPTAAVYFISEEVRERVLAKGNHEIILDDQTVKLHLTSASSPKSDDVSDNKSNLDLIQDPVEESKPPKLDVEPGNGAQAENKEELVQSATVLLDNVGDSMSRDLLAMLVENISGLDESSYQLEIIWEASRAIITFPSCTDVEKFLTVSRSSRKLEKHKITARRLEAAVSVRVEGLPPTMVKDMLELYFEKHWALPDNITMIPDEQAAILTFKNSKVVETICIKKDYTIGSIAVMVYPHYTSLGTTLYGEQRPTWQMPKPFTERVPRFFWKLIQMKKLSKSINDQMRPYFCHVNFDNPEVKLSPIPSFLKQKGLTAERVDNWGSGAREAFHWQMSQFSTFECPVNAAAWKAAEKEVCCVAREHAVLELDTSRGVLTVAGQADYIKKIKAPVENIVLKAMCHIERQTNAVSVVMNISPAKFYILNHGGLQKAALDISPEMILSYDGGSNNLTIRGLSAEVYKAKSWILEKNVAMNEKQLNVPPELLDFLKSMNPIDMSQDLFISQGISAMYYIESSRVLLLGCSGSALADAEKKMMTAFSVETVLVEDEEVLKLHQWMDLNKQLLDTFNLSKKKTLAIQIHPQRRDKILVTGFVNPVREAVRSMTTFIENYSRVQETIRAESLAVVHFIDKNKCEDKSSIARSCDVTINVDPERPKFTITGARLHVQKAKLCFRELMSSFFTDTLIVDKPGAKKYFLSQGSMFLSMIMSEVGCVVVLRPENQEEEEEEEENYEEGNDLCYCKVRMSNGVLLLVSKADLCSFSADAVVNAANEDLQHIGGLALALLKAAGPELQKISNDYISANGKLRPGDAIVTGACNLPCKYVVHAVGPRFSDSDRRTSVSRLKLVVNESLRQAEKVGCSTVALPAISSGVFGFPVDLCAQTIAETLREYCNSPGALKEIHLVDTNEYTVKVLATAVNKEFSDLGPTLTIPQQAREGAREKSSWASGEYQRGGDRWQSQSPTGRWFGERGRGGRGGRGGGRGDTSRSGVGFQGGQRGKRGGRSPRGYTKPGGYGGRTEQATPEGLKIDLQKGNIQDQTTDVIVNTISGDMVLTQGAVSKAIVQAAGPGLQSAVHSAAGGAARLQPGDIITTDGFNLKCRKVIHAVCPFWDNGNGQAEEKLISIIRNCLEEAEKLKMTSLSFPAIGTGNMSFPRNVVSRALLTEVHRHRRRHLERVVVVVHPSDSHTVDHFTRKFKGESSAGSGQHEAQEFTESPPAQSVSQSQQSSASFSAVSSPSLGVYQMQMGQLTLEVSSGDITKEACDVIVNSSNQDFTLKSGVSKAILDGAGAAVEAECFNIVNSPGYQPRPFILTAAGQLPSKKIIHVTGQKDPSKIREVVHSVLKFCEENRISSVSFPSIGTGQGGAAPSAVADAMMDAVVEFVRKSHPKFVCNVKILIFQTKMMTEFHKSMKKRQGEEVAEKGVIAKIKDFFRFGDKQPEVLVLEGEEFEPTVFQLCADNQKAVSWAKKRITDLIVGEQAERTIADPVIGLLRHRDLEQLKTLQRKLTVSIRLNRGLEEQEPNIQLEGLTRDVSTAESAIRDIIRKVEREENQRSKALHMSGLVEWQFQGSSGAVEPFDINTNLSLEEALEKKLNSVKIQIDGETFTADVALKKAASVKGNKEVELLRKELKAAAAALPANWDDMTGDIIKRVPVAAESTEYSDVETEMKKTGLTANIISIERVQNPTLWQSYQLMKTQMEVKNKHTNNERRLFHGTGEKSIDLINKRGFNRSYAGTHAAMFGKGSYFAVDPAYSARGYAKPDASGHKRMYLARVLVGDFTTGHPNMITPPSRGPANADLYDSVTDNAAPPTMFIIFSDIQAYPEHLITFT